MLIYWIFGILGFIFSEAIYLYVCSTETKKDLIKDGNWMLFKLVSFMFGCIGCLGIFAIYQGLKNYLKETLIVTIIVCSAIIFFLVNRKIGIAVAKGR